MLAFILNLLLAAIVLVAAAPSTRQKACAQVNGDFDVLQQGLYPESADWDPVGCKLYLSSLYNFTLVIFDPYKNTSEIIDLPGVTDHANATYTEYHLDGIDYDFYSGNIYISAVSANAFDSTNTGNFSNANYTGTNHVLIYNTRTQRIEREFDLGMAQQQYRQKTGNLTSGFQDMAEDRYGNSFAIGTFGNSILVQKKHNFGYWPETYNVTYGFGGVFSYLDKLIVSDTISGGFVTFNTSVQTPEAKYVPLKGLPSDYRPLMADGLFAPSKYGGKIALWSDDYNGTSVYGSNDGWDTSTYLGLVANDDSRANGSFSTATFEIGESIFGLVTFFQFELPVAPRSSFPFFDITTKVAEIVANSGFV